MCHEWWLQLGSQEREVTRRLWDEFEHTRQLSDPEVTEEEAELTLEQREPTAPSSRALSSMTRWARGSTLRARRPVGRGAHRARVLRCSLESSNQRVEEARVDEDAFNLSVRKFLKQLGVTAQREIELSVREQLEAGELAGDETLEAKATVVVSRLPRDVVVTGTIALT